MLKPAFAELRERTGSRSVYGNRPAPLKADIPIYSGQHRLQALYRYLPREREYSPTPDDAPDDADCTEGEAAAHDDENEAEGAIQAYIDASID